MLFLSAQSKAWLFVFVSIAARQWLDKQVTMATNKYATTE
jgi:hypothetical protein